MNRLWFEEFIIRFSSPVRSGRSNLEKKRQKSARKGDETVLTSDSSDRIQAGANGRRAIRMTYRKDTRDPGGNVNRCPRTPSTQCVGVHPTITTPGFEKGAFASISYPPISVSAFLSLSLFILNLPQPGTFLLSRGQLGTFYFPSLVFLFAISIPTTRAARWHVVPKIHELVYKHNGRVWKKWLLQKSLVSFTIKPNTFNGSGRTLFRISAKLYQNWRLPFREYECGSYLLMISSVSRILDTTYDIQVPFITYLILNW